MEDIQSDHTDFWIRATLFEVFPELLDFEGARRSTVGGYADILKSGGFEDVRVLEYAETRKCYSSYQELEAEILARKGKSILFELSDSELRRYCKRLKSQAPTNSLREVDRWTVWLAAR